MASPTPSPLRPVEPTPPVEPVPVIEAATATRKARLVRIARIVGGMTLLVIGVAMLVLPGPGLVVIVAGLALLAPSTNGPTGCCVPHASDWKRPGARSWSGDVVRAAATRPGRTSWFDKRTRGTIDDPSRAFCLISRCPPDRFGHRRDGRTGLRTPTARCRRVCFPARRRTYQSRRLLSE